MYWLLGAVAVDGLALAIVAIALVFTIGRPVMLKARPAPAAARSPTMPGGEKTLMSPRFNRAAGVAENAPV